MVAGQPSHETDETNPMTNLRILTPDDAEAFWRLRLQAFRGEPLAFGSTAEDHAGRPLSEVARELGQSEDHYAVGAFLSADRGEVLVGMLGLDRDRRTKRRHRAKVWGMYVDPPARGRGVGQALVDEIVARARRTAGLEQLYLTVMADNASARRLYERAGFAVYGRAPRAMILDGKGYDEHLLWLDLR
jgi:ribosomal protein S18 acetylase RimI-like enzyme